MQPIDAAIDGLELVVFAKNQPEYQPLPARVDNYGTVITCWKLTWRERFIALFRGTFYLTVLTFKHPLQPIRMSIDKPEVE
jgi:hypothetical protein